MKKRILVFWFWLIGFQDGDLLRLWEDQPPDHLVNPLPPRWWDTALLVRQLVNYKTRELNPNRGWCLRCGELWRKDNEHNVNFYLASSSREDGLSDGGVFPVCENCWRELGTPKKRWPFYRHHLRKDERPEVVEAIKAAVMAGK